MTPQPTSVRRLAALAEPPAPSALRGFHAELFDAVLWDGDLDRVVALTAAAVGAPVAIVVPRLQLAHVSPRTDGALVAAVVRHVGERMRGRPAKVPAEVLAEAPIARRGEPLGSVLMLAAPDASRTDDPDLRARPARLPPLRRDRDAGADRRDRAARAASSRTSTARCCSSCASSPTPTRS